MCEMTFSPTNDATTKKFYVQLDYRDLSGDRCMQMFSTIDGAIGQLERLRRVEQYYEAAEAWARMEKKLPHGAAELKDCAALNLYFAQEADNG